MENKKTLDANNNNEIKNFAVHDIVGTPFAVIEETESKHCKIVLGKNLVCGTEFPDIEKAKVYIKNKPWDLIANTIFVVANQIVEQKNK